MAIEWTPAALSIDIPAGTAVPRQVGERDLAIWRSQSGRIAAWTDRCPHRGMRLSHGFVRGEALSCIYHGWRYGQNGQCIKIPAHPDLAPPDAIRVPAFAVREMSGVVWIALSESAAPPPEFEGFAGFRSLWVEADAGAVAGVLGGGGGVVRCRLGPSAAVVLLQPLGTRRTVMHVLVPEGCAVDTLDAVSVAAEAARRQSESAAERGEAA